MKVVFKNIKQVLVAGASFTLLLIAAQLNAACPEHTLEERISPIGSICVEGEECKEEVAEVAAEAPKEPRSGSEIVGDYCAGCHQTGIMNAPKIGGNFKDLGSRGIEDLLASSKKGKNAMPRMGGCNDCSDEELSAAIQYMLDK